MGGKQAHIRGVRMEASSKQAGLIIFLYIVFLIYPAISGIKDAVLWSKKGTDSFKFDEHFIFVIERAAFIFSVLLTAYVVKNSCVTPWNILAIFFCWALGFPFVHNGSYYWGRSKIDKAYMGFFSDNPSYI